MFHALVRRKYDGAKTFNRWNHAHKWSVRPFLRAVADVLSEFINPMKPAVVIDKDERGNERVRFCFRLPDLKADCYPMPPLNVSMLHNGKPPDFQPQLARIAQFKNFRTIQAAVDHLANRRNQLLYASPSGIAAISSDVSSGLLKCRDHVFANLTLYMMIDPYPERQLFVQQCLNALLPVLERVKPPKPEPTAESGDWTI